MSTLQSSLRLSLIDRISSVAAKIAASLNGVGRAASGVRGGGFGSQIAAGANASARSVASLQTKLLVATAGLYAFQRASQGIINPAASFETKLLDIAQKADMSDSAMGQLGTRIRTMAKDLGRGAGDVASGMDILLGMGMKESPALSILPAITKAASAYNAEISDLAKASMAVMDNLKVRVDQMPAALDSMSRAGKEGAVELSDQSRYMASLAALGGTLKLKGVEGVAELSAALQVIRKGSGTAEEAATRLSDVLGKVTSPESVKKFSKLGVDIKKNLAVAQKAAEKAGKPFSAIGFVIDNVIKATKGDAGKIGDIFADKEARLGIIALIDHAEEFKRIYKEAMNSKGEVDKDYLRRGKTFQDTLRRFKGAAEELAISLGERVLPTLTRFMGAFSNIINTLDGRVSVFDKIGKAVAGFMNGLGLDDVKSIGDVLAKLSDAIFGTVADFESGTDRLGQIFLKFREFGASLRAFADSVTSSISAIEKFVGLDTGALTGFLGTVAGYGAGLAVAAVGLGLVAKSIMGVGRALLFVTGIKAATSIIKGLAGLGAGIAVPAATAATGAAAGAVATGGKGLLGRVASRASGVIGAALIAKDIIDTIGAKISEIREATTKSGLHSSPQSISEGEGKAAAYKAEIEEISSTLDSLRSKSRDPATFDIANQAAIARVAELRAALTNLEADLAAKRPAATPPTVSTWTPPEPEGVPTTAPLPPSRPPNLGALNATKDKAAEVKAGLDELNATLSPQVNLASLERTDALLDSIVGKLRILNSEGGKAVRTIAGARNFDGSPASGRGRSDVATATANLSRSRETNVTGRSFIGGYS